MRRRTAQTISRGGGASRVDPTRREAHGRRPVFTGNENSDRLITFIAAYTQRIPGEFQEAVRSGVQSLPFNYRYLEQHTGLRMERVVQALELLQDQGYLVVDFGPDRGDGSRNIYGARLWLRAKLVDAA